MRNRIASVAPAEHASEACLPAAGAGGARRAGRRGEGRAAGAERRRRARRAARADGGGGRRGRRARRAGTTRTASRCATATRRGEVTLGGRRVPVERPRARTADGRQRGAARDLRALRRPRPADDGGAGADARRRLDAPLRAHAGAGRRGDRARRALDVASRRSRASSSSARASTLGELMSRRARRRAPGGDDARRDRAQGPLQRRRARDHDRRASRSRSGSGTARPRTRPSRPRCWPTSSSAASTPSRACCS